MTNIGIVDRTKAGLLGLLVALSLIVSALPASAAYKYDGLDFIDATGLTWERTPKNITWENITWEQSLRVRLPVGGGFTLQSITWE